MRKMRDLFYIDANFEESYYLIYGMTFNEFIRFNPTQIENILVPNVCYYTNSFNKIWQFDTAIGVNSILSLSEKDIYSLGDFHWIDFKSESCIDECSPEEKAQVLYLSHFWKPMLSPFFEKFNNNYFYLGHDDGYYCKLYCKDMSVMKSIIANKIIASVSTNKKRKIYSMSDNVKDEILELTKKGLLIDFSNIYKFAGNIGLDFYTIGHLNDMDDMYNNREKYMFRSETVGSIEQNNKKWVVTNYQRN